MLEKCAPKTGFPHSTELDWVAEVMALFREVSKTPAPDIRETEAANTPWLHAAACWSFAAHSAIEMSPAQAHHGCQQSAGEIKKDSSGEKGTTEVEYSMLLKSNI